MNNELTNNLWLFWAGSNDLYIIVCNVINEVLFVIRVKFDSNWAHKCNKYN